MLLVIASHWKVDHGLRTPVEQQRDTTGITEASVRRALQLANSLMLHPSQILNSTLLVVAGPVAKRSTLGMRVCPLTATRARWTRFNPYRPVSHLQLHASNYPER